MMKLFKLLLLLFSLLLTACIVGKSRTRRRSIVDLINEYGIEVIKEKTQGLVSKPLVEVVKGLWNIIPICKKPVQNII